MYKYIVYKTTCKVNGMIYVGVHGTNVDIDDGYIGCGLYKTSKRFKGRRFHKAVKQFGGDAFYREILFEYPFTEEGKKLAYQKEAEIVNKDFLKRKDVYNSMRGGVMVDNLNPKQIAQYEINGTFIKVWSSLKEIEITLGYPDSSIGNACLKKSYSNGYQWRFFNGSTDDIDPITTTTKVVYQFDLQGNYIAYYKSIADAGRAIGIPGSHISNVINGNWCQAGGYYWNTKKRFEYTPRKWKVTAVACYTDEGKFIKSYTTLTEAAKDYQVGLSSIHRVISGERKRCCGVRWRYFYGNTDDIPPL